MPFPELTALARELERSDSQDPAVQRRNMQCLRELRDFARTHGAPELAACLDATAHLMLAVTMPSEVLARTQIQSIAANLLNQVDAALGTWGMWPPEGASLEAPGVAPVGEASKPEASGAASDHADRARTPEGDAEPRAVPEAAAVPAGGLPNLPEAPRPIAPPVEAPEVASEPPAAAPEPPAAPQATELPPAADAAPSPPPPPTSPLAETPAPKPAAPDKAPCVHDVGVDTPMPAVHDMVLGELLIELGHINRKQLEAALEFHEAQGMRVGECLLLQGSVGPDELLETLKIQDRMRTLAAKGRAVSVENAKQDTQVRQAVAAQRPKGAPHSTAAMKVTENMFFGEVLLGAEMVDNEQLESAMHIHHLEGIMVGEALVKIGALTPEQVQQGLELQARLRHIAGLSRPKS